MEIVTAAQMRDIDRKAIEAVGIPGVVLMEHAGLRVTEAIRELGCGPNVVILAGRGNNGGDGFVVARHLAREKNVSVWTTAAFTDYRGDARINLAILQNMGIACRTVLDEGALPALRAELSAADLVVDAMLGTGISREVDPLLAAIICAVNESRGFVLSVDIPSGVCADSGKILGRAVYADLTVTLALPKRGLLCFPGAACTGRLEVADIGIPPGLLQGHGFSLITPETARRLLPQRPADGHKGTFGSVLLVAGSRGMSGAVALAARAALRGGCGLVFAATPRSVQPTVAAQVAEAITVPLPENRLGRLQADSLYILREKWRTCQAVGVGPGMSQDDEALPVLAAILRECPLPAVLDADALNLLAKNPELMDGRQAPVVMTPHPGEAARLLECSIEDVQADRVAAAQKLAGRFGSTVILKGAHSLIAEPGGELALNVTGNSGMATAGSGDVLTGLLASLLAQGLETSRAARVAVYLHGLAGDLAAQSVGEASLVAGDIIECICEAYLKTEKIHM
ncbi:MAG: NAD(P)H-hydrate dehydratase [Bacillota bacterium]|nr:NAD(P)H-hydrate dehydratase [Bacillota bacterium]MDW7683670.1 NAD(P)H-hydrate dehydratase [Bacillota bacterium]